MNKKQKALKRKLLLFSSLFNDIQSSLQKQTFIELKQHAYQTSTSVLTQRERRLIWQKLKETNNSNDTISRSSTVKVDHTKKILYIIKRRILQTRNALQKQAFETWRDHALVKQGNYTKFKQLTITTAEKTQADNVTRIRLELQNKLKELEQVKEEAVEVEEQEKTLCNQRIQEVNTNNRRIAVRRIAGIIKVKGLMTSFQMIRAAAEFNKRKVKLMRQIPLPRKKQWWERLMEHELDHFYKQVDVQKAPKRYRDLIRFIVEHKLIKHIITIQRHFRRRKMKEWIYKNGSGVVKPGQTVKVDVSFLETATNKERGQLECFIF